MLAVKFEPMFAEKAKERQAQAEGKPRGEKKVSVSADLHEETHKRRSDTKAGRAFGVGHSTVSKAQKIVSVKPDKVEEIKNGKTTVDAEYKRINQEEAEREAKEKRIYYVV